MVAQTIIIEGKKKYSCSYQKEHEYHKDAAIECAICGLLFCSLIDFIEHRYDEEWK
jgi:hypothetical protein